MRFAREGLCTTAVLTAAAKPAIEGAANVPDRTSLSWPPP